MSAAESRKRSFPTETVETSHEFPRDDDVVRSNECMTLTFGDVAEAHVGNEHIGKAWTTRGWSADDLRGVQKAAEQCGAVTEWIALHEKAWETESDDDDDDRVAALPGHLQKSDFPPAYVLVVRRGVQAMGLSPDDVCNEQRKLKWDEHAWMRGQVRRKRARHNLCYGPSADEPNYAQKRGRVVSFASVPHLESLRAHLVSWLAPSAETRHVAERQLAVAEGNRYYDVQRCGIGFHGDAERKYVAAVRLGASMPLHYQWFYRHAPVGRRVASQLHDGDVYFMSDKAVGHDWKSSTCPTLRHAAGAPVYLRTKQ